MPYLGRALVSGNYQKLDDLQSQFNGTATTFNLTSGGQAFYPGSAYSILVSLGGVIQEPIKAYTINLNQITFASAPASGSSFFCIVLGTALGIGVPGENTVTGSKLSQPFNYNSGLLYLDSASNRVGIGTTVPAQTLSVNGSLGIGTISVISSARQLQNIASLDAVTAATIESAIASGPNTFTDLQVTGLSTFTNGPVLIGTGTSTGTASQTLQVTGGGYFSSSVGIGTTNPQSQLQITGQFQSTQANSTADGGGQIFLNGATGNRIDFVGVGVAAPSFATRSAGTKIVLYPNVDVSLVDYAFGVESNTLWYSIPNASSTRQHRWYAGTTQLADLKGTGELLLGTTTATGTASQKLQVTGGAYVSGNLGVGATNPLAKLDSRGTVLIATTASGNNLLAFGNTGYLGGTLSGAPDSSYGSSFILGNHSNTSGAPSYLSFWTTSGGIVVERKRIHSTGEVSIGSTTTTGTASQALQVNSGAYVSGNLGVGSTNPSTKLVVTQASAATCARFETGGSQVNIRFSDSTTTNQVGVGAIGNDFIVTMATGGERLRVTSSGSVGIATTNPQYTLHVNGSFAATTKSFVIPHPSKPNYKLRYACLEGPENSVYVRGRTTEHVIELPEYWVNLVDENSITVNLTPIGNKTVWVEEINNNKVYINSEDTIDCFYTVFAERKDVEKLVVEVEEN